jgi:hypothetical protein
VIAKERNAAEHPDPDKFTAAGAKAEEQMAFYLRRAFGDPENKEVMLFNDLRLANDRGDDFAQIDHLVFYRRGMIVVESKSVASEVKINAHGEWSRMWDGAWKGMESPIFQVKRQVLFLSELLAEHAPELRGKMPILGLQLKFGACPFDVIVAISDKGSIDRGGGKFPEVMKAEAVVDGVKAIIARHRLGMLTPSLDTSIGAEKFGDDEMLKIRDFLKRRHCPIISAAPAKVGASTKPIVLPKPIVPPIIKPLLTPQQSNPEIQQVRDSREASSPICETAPSASSTAVPAKSCRGCKGNTLNVEYGKFGYYLKCRDCDGNTPIDFSCACGQKARVRKEKDRFFKECGVCGASGLYHTNQ